LNARLPRKGCAAVVAEAAARWIKVPALWTAQLQSRPAGVTELRPLRVFSLTLGARHLILFRTRFQTISCIALPQLAPYNEKTHAPGDCYGRSAYAPRGHSSVH